MFKPVYAGKLTRRIEFFKQEKQATPTGERITVMLSQGKKYAERRDVQASEDEQGRLVALNVCTYIIRYSDAIMAGGSAMLIKDFDGVWNVTGVSLFSGNGRKRFLQLKCDKYAGTITI